MIRSTPAQFRSVGTNISSHLVVEDVILTRNGVGDEVKKMTFPPLAHVSLNLLLTEKVSFRSTKMFDCCFVFIARRLSSMGSRRHPCEDHDCT